MGVTWVQSGAHTCKNFLCMLGAMWISSAEVIDLEFFTSSMIPAFDDPFWQDNSIHKWGMGLLSRLWWIILVTSPLPVPFCWCFIRFSSQEQSMTTWRINNSHWLITLYYVAVILSVAWGGSWSTTEAWTMSVSVNALMPLGNECLFLLFNSSTCYHIWLVDSNYWPASRS